MLKRRDAVDRLKVAADILNAVSVDEKVLSFFLANGGSRAMEANLGKVERIAIKKLFVDTGIVIKYIAATANNKTD